ncbi:LysR family transcriptional regulator [Acidocella sp.]|uniref:LysR family transcriptional regulator n=1 Tax=Acidocella sp. TaxID=50710 RepID=UPI002613E646|nr:LysR family transcriptional regulator [Acidocella sp.]
MTLEQLRIFAAVAEREHVTKAAGLLNLTQAAVSASVAALEQQHGVKLFDRLGRGVALTAAGRQFLPEAKALLRNAAAAEAALADFAGLQRGRLKVHASQTIASYLLPAVLAGFRREHPGVTVELAIGNTAQVARALREGEAELGFVEGPFEAADLSVAEVAAERMTVFVPHGHPWGQGGALTPRDLRRADWVFREAGSGTREAFLAALAGLGIEAGALNIVMTLPSNEAVREAVAAGAGVGCLSPLVCDRAVQAGVLRRANLLLPPRQFNAVRHKERYVSQASAAFLRAAQAWRRVL